LSFRNVTALGIEQELVYVANEAGKLLAIKNLFKGGFQPPILIFVQSKKRANDLFKELVLEKVNVDVISGDRSQPEVIFYVKFYCVFFLNFVFEFLFREITQLEISVWAKRGF